MDAFINKMTLFCIVIAGAFSVGHRLGQEAQCVDMGAEYHKGKCVLVQRTEMKL